MNDDRRLQRRSSGEELAVEAFDNGVAAVVGDVGVMTAADGDGDDGVPLLRLAYSLLASELIS